MRLNILLTAESYYPDIDGVAYVIQNVSERLAAHGHTVTVATTYHPERDFEMLNGVKICHFSVSGNQVFGCQGEIESYTDFISSFKGDILVNYAAQNWLSDLVYPLLHKLRCKKLFIPCGYSGLHDDRYKLYFAEMPGILKKYDHIIYHSANYQDKYFGDDHGITHYSIIPNGAQEDEFLKPQSGFRQRYGIRTSKLFLSVGNFGAAKNQEFVLRAYLNTGISDSTLVFIGAAFNSYSWKVLRKDPNRNGLYNPIFKYRTLLRRHIFNHLYPIHCLEGPSIRGLNVKILEQVPREMVVSAYHEADLFLYGSIVECFPLVIVEAMASGTPFITTNCGNVAELPGGVVVSSTSEMTQTICLLADKGSAWEKLSQEGRLAWERHYQWDKIAESYEKLFLQQLGK